MCTSNQLNYPSLHIRSEGNYYFSEPTAQKYLKYLGFEEFLTYLQDCISSKQSVKNKSSWENFFSQVYSHRSANPQGFVDYANFLVLIQILECYFNPEKDTTEPNRLGFSLRFTPKFKKYISPLRDIWNYLYEFIYRELNCSTEHYLKAAYITSTLDQTFSFILRENAPATGLETILSMWSPKVFEYCVNLPEKIVQRVITNYFRKGKSLVELFSDPIDDIHLLYLEDQLSNFQVLESHTTVLCDSINHRSDVDFFLEPNQELINSDLDLLDYILTDDLILANPEKEQELTVLNNAVKVNLDMDLLCVPGFLIEESSQLIIVHPDPIVLIAYHFEFVIEISNFKIINFLNREKIIFYTQPLYEECKLIRPTRIFKFLVRKFTKIKIPLLGTPSAA
jgi:hypothetical protein